MNFAKCSVTIIAVTIAVVENTAHSLTENLPTVKPKSMALYIIADYKNEI